MQFSEKIIQQVSNRTAIVVTPKEPFIKWVQGADAATIQTTVEEIMEGPNVYLVDDTSDGMGEERLLKKNFASIFEEELNSAGRFQFHGPERHLGGI